jgi:hypothetical protein
MINAIKNKLSDYLTTLTQNLSDEDISMLSKIKENGIKPLIQHVMKSKDFTAISLLNIAYALNTNNNVVNEKLKEDNQKIIEEISRLENDLIYTDVLHKFYEPKNADSLKIATKLSDLNTHELDIPYLQAVPFINFDNGTYINPYNNSAFDVESKTDGGSDINSLTNPYERSIQSTVRMSVLSQTSWLENSGKDHAGLMYSFSKKEIAKMGVEFVLFHELAHSAAKKYLFDGKNDESFADICGIMQVIKNNDLSQEDAIKFVNRILLYRSEPSSIAYYATNFEDDPNNTPSDRYHFTQSALLYFKEVLQTSFTNLKEMPIKEQAIFAANLVVAQTFCGVEENIKDRLAIYDQESTDIYIDEILATEQDYLEELAHYQKIPVEDVIARIKHNISDDPKKILDINFHVLYKRNEDTIYEIDSFFPLETKFIMELHKHSLANYKEINIERNFSHADLVKELDRNEIKRKPKL